MVRGGLFTRYFLDDGIRMMDQYRRITTADAEAFADVVRTHWTHLEQMPHPSEAETEAEFIFPILGRLGWEHLPQQEPGRGRRDIADALLFLDSTAKARARPLPAVERFRLGAVVVENEARDTRLDRGAGTHEAPSSQILRYLGRAEPLSDGAVRWGLLTNGRFWRLYWSQARARAEGFVEIDLPALVDDLSPPVPVEADAQHWLRVFMLIFGHEALVPGGTRGETFLDLALAEGRRYEQQITEALSRVVFQKVYPDLVEAIGLAAPNPRPHEQAWRMEVRDASLRLLFRLLFLLYAEDRDLLPVRLDGYRQYGLQPMRDEAAEIVDGRRVVSDQRTTWWLRLTNLFGAIANGDTEMGLPPYNGGLFDDHETPLLARIALPDRTLAGLIDALSREADGHRWINYRDLSVQHLGSIYERLLEWEVATKPDGGLGLQPSIFARKTTGSYYTPEELVRLILRRAVAPLLAERRQAFINRAGALASDRRPKAERLRHLSAYDSAEAFIRLRVCDPAMGSGHFLVSLVDYLADEVLTEIVEPPALVTWADPEAPYRSPLVERIERLRAEIRRSADQNNWPVPDEQLDDRHLVRRLILKRVIYGVDLNPMAVELAKLSLWLHSFTVGAPLSFLDHHLRCGDSTEWESTVPRGGFDAVIGNPPWDRMKLQEVEWFAARVPAIAHAQRAVDRKRMVGQLQRRGDPIAADYHRAAWTAETGVKVARTGGAYPTLSSGDVNIYSLFVERALRLVRRDGIVGLLVPSGIAADKGAAEFFRSISTTGRLAALLDFENRRPTRDLDPFFPDVDSRFKFCAFVAGGPERTFARADCAFFKQHAVAAEAEAFPLTPEDFTAVNPNTGTAPVFRGRRDAEITLDIYRRFPVLVDRRGEEPVFAWPVRYLRMFDMTNDLGEFRTASELESLGAYRVAGQHWEKGGQRWLPLYEEDGSSLRPSSGVGGGSRQKSKSSRSA